MNITAAGKTFPLDMRSGLTLGELRMLKRHYDLPDADKLNASDPDHMAGLIFVAMRRAQPHLGDAAVMDAVDRLDTVTVELEDYEKADAEAAADPNHEAGAAAPA